MTTAAEKFFGGAKKYTLAQFAAIPFQPVGKRSPRVHVVNAGGGVTDMYLPDARNLQTGGPHFFICYPDFLGGNDIGIYNHDKSVQIVLITDPEVAVLWLLDNSTEQGVWLAKVMTWNEA